MTPRPQHQSSGTQHHEVLIVGGGSAGIAVAARLLQAEHPPQVAILDPAQKHYYQPLWTLVGGGVVDKHESERDEASVIPDGATWIQDAATGFDPDHNAVMTRSSGTLTYDYLVVCPGIQINWKAIPGLAESLGKNGVCSNYSWEHCDYTWETVQRIANQAGPVRALFTQPTGAITPPGFYGTDAGHLYAHAGLEGVVCGPGGRYNTMPDERVDIPDYLDLIRIYLMTACDICELQ